MFAALRRTGIGSNGWPLHRDAEQLVAGVIDLVVLELAGDDLQGEGGHKSSSRLDGIKLAHLHHALLLTVDRQDDQRSPVLLEHDADSFAIRGLAFV